MEKVILRQDGEQVGEQEALQHKNFTALMSANKNNKPGSEGSSSWVKWSLRGMGIIAAAGLLFFTTNKKTTPPVTDKDSTLKTLNRPLPNIPVVYETFTYLPTKDTAITSANGSAIVIAKNTLVNKNGQLLSDTVTLKYREFRDMVDVFVSGIPMVYDSAGTAYHFESAGMFELLAFDGEQEAFIAPDKQVEIRFASDYAGDKYNIYSYDIQAEKWSYLYKDTCGYATAATAVEQRVAPAPSSATNNLPAPVLATPNKQLIQLDVLEEEFPEIAAYKNVRFEIVEEKGFDASLNSIEWDMVSLDKNEAGNYSMRLIVGKRVEEFEVQPVFAQADYEAALQVFEANYLAAQKIKDAQKAKGQKALDTLYQQLNEQQESLTYSRFVNSSRNTAQASSRAVIRVFSLANFGIFNSDCPSMLPQGRIVDLALTDKDNAEENKDSLIQHNKVFLVEKNKNAIYTYTDYNLNKFSYNPASTNMIWTVTKDNKLAVLKFDEFNSAKSRTIEGKTALEVSVVNVKFSSTASLRHYLGI